MLNITHKILFNGILRKIKSYAEEIITNYQCGFISRKSTIDHIFTSRKLTGKHYEFDKQLHLLFVDFNMIQLTTMGRKLETLSLVNKNYSNLHRKD